MGQALRRQRFENVEQGHDQALRRCRLRGLGDPTRAGGAVVWEVQAAVAAALCPEDASEAEKIAPATGGEENAMATRAAEREQLAQRGCDAEDGAREPQQTPGERALGSIVQRGTDDDRERRRQPQPAPGATKASKPGVRLGARGCTEIAGHDKTLPETAVAGTRAGDAARHDSRRSGAAAPHRNIPCRCSRSPYGAR